MGSKQPLPPKKPPVAPGRGQATANAARSSSGAAGASGSSSGGSGGWEVGVYRTPQQLRALLEWLDARGVREAALAGEVRQLLQQHEKWREGQQQRRKQQQEQQEREGQEEEQRAANSEAAGKGEEAAGSEGVRDGVQPMEMDGNGVQVVAAAGEAGAAGSGGAGPGAQSESEAQRLAREMLEVYTSYGEYLPCTVVLEVYARVSALLC